MGHLESVKIRQSRQRGLFRPHENEDLVRFWLASLPAVQRGLEISAGGQKVNW